MRSWIRAFALPPRSAGPPPALIEVGLSGDGVDGDGAAALGCSTPHAPHQVQGHPPAGAPLPHSTHTHTHTHTAPRHLPRRRFLLEWLSFQWRYIPVGLLEVVPQRMHWQSAPFVGRCAPNSAPTRPRPAPHSAASCCAVLRCGLARLTDAKGLRLARCRGWSARCICLCLQCLSKPLDARWT